MEYDQFVRGTNLGVFPSYYEPWGYTPLECMALGVPAVTSDLAGFGNYIQQMMPDHHAKGVANVPRRGRSFEDSANILADQLHAFCQLKASSTTRSTAWRWSEGEAAQVDTGLCHIVHVVGAGFKPAPPAPRLSSSLASAALLEKDEAGGSNRLLSVARIPRRSRGAGRGGGPRPRTKQHVGEALPLNSVPGPWPGGK